MSGSTPRAPALENGLDILEAAAAGPIGFNDLVERLPMSRASVARLVHILCQRGYLTQANGRKYSLGNALAELLGPEAQRQRFAALAQPHLRELMALTGCSTLLLHWDGCAFTAIAKAHSETGPAMQELGSVSTDLSRYPWGWLVYQRLTTEAQRLARARMHEPALIDQALQAMARQQQKPEVAYDDQLIGAHQRRLAVLLRDQDTHIIGALALGGNPLIMPDDQISHDCDLLRMRKATLEAALTAPAARGGFREL